VQLAIRGCGIKSYCATAYPFRQKFKANLQWWAQQQVALDQAEQRKAKQLSPQDQEKLELMKPYMEDRNLSNAQKKVHLGQIC
jgi:hypothetical protein